MSRVGRLLVVAMISASLAVFASGSATFGAVRKVALGVHMIDSRNVAAVDAFTASVGRKPAIWTLWSDWGQNGGVADKSFPTAAATALKDRGIVPMIMWEPINPANQTDCPNWSNQALLGTQYNQYIHDWALAAKNHGGRILLRFMHEMNGSWYIWGMGRCTNTATTIKQVWRKVWNIFQEVGATNVKFLWSVAGKNNVSKVYPGGAYVNYMGLSAFNWARNLDPTKYDSWRSMVTAFAPAMKVLLNISAKPIIAAEVGTGELLSCSTCSKPNWIKNGYPAVRSKWPRVKAIVYLNIDLRGVGHPDWRLTSPPAAFDQYKIIANDIRFKGVIP